MTTFHNPENLTPDQYGAKEGWRLLTESEVDMIPMDSEVYFRRSDRWEKSSNRGHTADSVTTYRTRAPLPAGPDIWIKRSFRAPDASEFPVWYFGRPVVESDGMVWRATEPSSDVTWTHWKKADKAPAFPLKEKLTPEDDRAWLRIQLDKYHAGEINPQQFINAVSGRVKE